MKEHRYFFTFMFFMGFVVFFLFRLSPPDNLLALPVHDDLSSIRIFISVEDEAEFNNHKGIPFPHKFGAPNNWTFRDMRPFVREIHTVPTPCHTVYMVLSPMQHKCERALYSTHTHTTKKHLRCIAYVLRDIQRYVVFYCLTGK